MLRKGKRIDRGERGAVMTMGTAAVVAVLLMIGLTVDLGSAYLSRARLYKAVDAAALAAARQTPATRRSMRRIARRVARANYDRSGVDYAVSISQGQDEVTRVRVTGEYDSRTSFLKLAGREKVRVRASAEATRFPLDMSLVLDVSYQLEHTNAFVDMQEGARAFLERFDENLDQIGIVSYSMVAREVEPLDRYFLADGLEAIDELTPLTYANIEEGLRRGSEQIDTPPSRSGAVAIMVLFSTGRPTAFRDLFDVVDPPDTYDGVIAARTSGNGVVGLFDPVYGMQVIGFRKNGTPVLVPYGPGGGGGGRGNGGLSDPMPNELPGGLPVNGRNIRYLGMVQAEAQAAAARANGQTIYCIGLGNPNSGRFEDLPDMDFLRRMANQHGISNAEQPRGEALLAPSTSELEEVFEKMAERILLRITR